MKNIEIKTYRNLLRKTKQYCQEYKTSKYIYFKMFWYCFTQILKINKNSTNTRLKKNDTLLINIAISGGIGDILCRSVWIKEFSKILNCNYKINLFILDKSKLNATKSIFYKNHYISSIFYNEDYTCNCDLSILVDNVPSIKYANNEKISNYSKDLAIFLEKYINFEKEYFDFFNDNIETYYARLILLAINTNKKLAQLLDVYNLLGIKANTSANICINPEYYSILDSTNLKNKKYITFVYDVDCRSTLNNNVRLWPLENYKELILKIKQKYTDIKTIQIGTQRSPLIPEIDIDLRGKTNFEELKIILKNSIIHIDGECGMVHLKHYLNGISLVLFGQTSIEVKGYNNNINIKSNACPHWCEWIISNWQTHCIRGYKEPPCLKEIQPNIVFNKLEAFLDTQANDKKINIQKYNELNNIINSNVVIFGKNLLDFATTLSKYNNVIIYDYEASSNFITKCKNNNIKFDYADIYNLPNESNSCDFVIIENLKNDIYESIKINEITRILKNNGSLLTIK